MNLNLSVTYGCLFIARRFLMTLYILGVGLNRHDHDWNEIVDDLYDRMKSNEYE